MKLLALSVTLFLLLLSIPATIFATDVTIKSSKSSPLELRMWGSFVCLPTQATASNQLPQYRVTTPDATIDFFRTADKTDAQFARITYLGHQTCWLPLHRFTSSARLNVPGKIKDLLKRVTQPDESGAQTDCGSYAEQRAKYVGYGDGQHYSQYSALITGMGFLEILYNHADDSSRILMLGNNDGRVCLVDIFRSK